MVCGTPTVTTETIQRPKISRDRLKVPASGFPRPASFRPEISTKCVSLFCSCWKNDEGVSAIELPPFARPAHDLTGIFHSASMSQYVKSHQRGLPQAQQRGVSRGTTTPYSRHDGEQIRCAGFDPGQADQDRQ